MSLSFTDLEKSIIATKESIAYLTQKVDTLLSLMTEKKAAEIPPFSTPKQFCELAGISLTTFATKRNEGEINVSVKGRRVYVTRDEVMRYFSANGNKFVKPNNSNKK